MPKRELDQHGVDGSNLHAKTAAGISDFGSLNVVFPIRLEKAKRSKSLDQLTACLRSCKALKEFLQHKTRGEDLVRSIKGVSKRVDFRCRSLSVPAKCERPHAGINEKTHY